MSKIVSINPVEYLSNGFINDPSCKNIDEDKVFEIIKAFLGEEYNNTALRALPGLIESKLDEYLNELSKLYPQYCTPERNEEFKNKYKETLNGEKKNKLVNESEREA